MNKGMNDLTQKKRETPELSVIVPVFNAEAYLEKCLSSIVNQTFRDLEIIIVDDGSTDAGLEICNRYGHLDRRIKIISKKQGGLINARKTGMEAAQGKWIGFVDSDDWIEPGMYEQLLDCAEENDCDMVSSGIIREYEAVGKAVYVYDHYREGLYDNLESTIYPSMLYSDQYKDFGLYCTLVNKIYKRDILTKIYENINENVFYGEDALTCYPYCLSVQSIYILHKAFYHYNIRAGSMCSAPDERLPYNGYLLYQGLLSAFQKTKCSMVLIRQLKKYMRMIERHTLSVLYHIDAVALDEWNFSFPKTLYDKQFVVYGAGTCGQALYRRICDTGQAQNMVLWVDKNAQRKAEECAYPIKKPVALVDVEYDIILIAVEAEQLAIQIMQELTEVYQIERKKMVWKEVEHIPVWGIY